MPSKGKVKRLQRNRRWRVARRRNKKNALLEGKGRVRKKRPKNKEKVE